MMKCLDLLVIINFVVSTVKSFSPAKYPLQHNCNRIGVIIGQGVHYYYSKKSNDDDALIKSIRNFPITNCEEACHVFHGRGGVYPGFEHLTLDYYPPVWLITSFQPVTPIDLSRWETALAQKMKEISICSKPASASNTMDNNIDVNSSNNSSLTWVYQDRNNSSQTQTTLMSGQIPEPHIVQENNNSYVVQILKGKNNGLFLDMAQGRKWVQEHASGRKVLNLFAYSCSFSIAALRGGATEVINVDMSRGALKIGQRNHNLNKIGSRCARFLCHNIFKSWGKLKKLGPYDLIICDPPTYQKGSFVAQSDYGKVIRRLPDMLIPGGYALLCLNAPELDSQFLMDQVQHEAPGLIFCRRLENPDTYPVVANERALKVLLFRRSLQRADTKAPIKEF